MKKIMTIAAAAACIALMLCGCGKEAPQKSEKKTETTAASDSSRVEKKVVTDAYGSMAEFSSETLSGKTLTQDDLAGFDLTMIYIWQTTCEPCKNEFPALIKLKEQLPEGTQLIGMCVDAPEKPDDAKKISDEAGLTFDSIMGGAGITGISGTPAVIYVDKAGNVIGEPRVGRSFASDTDAMVQEFFIDISSHLGMAKIKYAEDGEIDPEAETAQGAVTP